jgi:hypothetical protein
MAIFGMISLIDRYPATVAVQFSCRNKDALLHRFCCTFIN